MPAEVIYDEVKVPAYMLPDPLTDEAGLPVRSAADWHGRRRPELLDLFARRVYGRPPDHPEEMTFLSAEGAQLALGGLARRKQATILITGNGQTVAVDVLMYLPRSSCGPVPVFVGLNFYGNHTVQADPGVRLPGSWVPDGPAMGVVEHRATDAGRGLAACRWDVAAILNRGFGLVTAYCGDFDPDWHDGWTNGVHPLFYGPGQTAPAADEWGTIGAWAWGLSRILDFLETEPEVDARRVTVMGHSRLGKTALWAGARDARFAAVISNNSGCGGAALFRRCFGETITRINTAFPHWFCQHFSAYNDHEERLPVDQHQLLALVAPRPVYVASADEDRWADPRGEFLAAWYASPVYRLLGHPGLNEPTMPPPQCPVGGRIGYHLRRGVHDVTPYDWQCWLDFVERHLEASPVADSTATAAPREGE